MKQAIAQKHDFGCGAACVAFVSAIAYDAVIELLGADKASKRGFFCRDLVVALGRCHKAYTFGYIKPKVLRRNYDDNTIIFIQRSARYPAGHYLVRHGGQWMDPWINFLADSNVANAKAGFRKRLPGKPQYALYPSVAH